MATSKEHEKDIRNLTARVSPSHLSLTCILVLNYDSSCTHQIKLNEAFNGIKFTSAEWEVVAKGRTSCVLQCAYMHSASIACMYIQYCKHFITARVYQMAPVFIVSMCILAQHTGSSSRWNSSSEKLRLGNLFLLCLIKRLYVPLQH